MLNGIKAVCNKGCGKTFMVKDLNTKYISSDIEKTYFNCPHCGEEYICLYTDENIRKMQKKQEKFIYSGNKEMTKLLTIKIRQEMDKLKATIEN